MNELWERLRIGAEQIGTVVPALVGAAVILLTGYFLARQIQRWADDTLKRLDFNKVAHAGGLDEVVERTGSSRDPVRTTTSSRPPAAAMRLKSSRLSVSSAQR